jgi:hypothetical protein
MNRILLIIVALLATVMPMKAQSVTVNYDAKTIAAMAVAYGAEAASEAYYNEQVKKILAKYSAAEVATAGIFASKYLDRKALTDLGIWNSSTENYYYRRIYKLVSTKIMPKIWTVAGQMLHSPQTALYWGSYLMKICTETKTLCMQFESVITNSQLSFKDEAFLELTPQLQSLFKLSETGNIDWKTFLDSFGNISHNFTTENLKADINKLYNLGVGLANAGAENVMSQLLGKSEFNGTFASKANSIATVVNNSYNFYQSLDKSMGTTFLNAIGGKATVSRLFNINEYNMTSWMTDYVRETVGQYYTQRWYIYRRDSGTEVLCDYTPSTDDNSIVNGAEWTRFDTTDENFYPNSEQTEQILSNSESYAGYSRAQVKQLNAANDGFSYYISYVRLGYTIFKKSKQVKKAYAYTIKVTKGWNNTEEAYDEVFDSYSMDLAGFKAKMNALLAEYNDNEDGYVYYLASDAKNYYQATDAAKMTGCESVIISVTCSDGATLIDGNTQYKCKKCGSSLNAHSKECAMLTTLSNNDLDLSEFDTLEQEYTQQAAQLQSQINALERQNALIVKQIGTASTTEVSELRLQYNKNKEDIATLKAELAEVQQKQSDLQQAREDAAAENDVETDDYYRIPAIMQDCKTAYSLTWKSDGAWSGYTFTREATSPNINGTITFEATLNLVRKPKYFLGIQIHRAILGITWKLKADYSDTQVVDILTFDDSKSDADKAKEVNQRISEIAQEYPSCQVSTEYIKSDPTVSDSSTDTYHLLWSSDRLEIAREIDSRLTHIYADLVSLEKMMNYKLSIVDVLRNISPYVNTEDGRRLTLVEQARRRWLRNAAKTSHSINYNGKYDDEE